MKKLLRYSLTFIVMLVCIFGLLPMQDAKAGTETYNHIIPITITDTSGVARTNVPVTVSLDVSGNLTDYGMVNATATDTYVDYTGAGNSPVGDGTAVDFMMASSNITCIIPSLSAYGSVTINLYTGYSPEQTSFPIITGDGGYVTVSDSNNLEMSSNGTVTLNTYLTTSGNFTEKFGSFSMNYNSSTSNVTVYQDGTANLTQPDYDTTGTLYSGSDVRRGERIDAFTGNVYFFGIPLSKSGSPTGTLYARIRRVDTDAIVSTLGSMDVSTLTGDATWYYFAYEAVDISATNVRFLVEYSGGDVANNVVVHHENSNVIAGQRTQYTVAGGYADAAGTDAAFDIGKDASVLLTSTTTAGLHEIQFTAGSYNDTWLDFSGTDNVSTTNSSTLNFTSASAYTFEAWVNPTTATDSAFYNRASGATGYVFAYISGKMAMYHAGFGAKYDTTVLDLGEWQHIAATWDGTGDDKVRFYVNGVLSSTSVATGTINGNSTYGIIGGKSGGFTDPDWLFDEFRIYSRALDAPELLANYNLGREDSPQPTDDTDLELWYHIDERTGATLDDETTNGFDGTIVGAAWGDLSYKIWVDDVEGDAASVIGNSLLDTTSNWKLFEGVAYTDNITISVNNTQQLLFKLNAIVSGNTIPDRASDDTDNDGTITWGSNSSITITAKDITDSESATSVGATSALMNGELFDLGTFTSVYASFEYGLDTNYGYFTSETAKTTTGAFSVTLTGLDENTTYHYRAISRSGVVYSYGEDTTFTTALSSGSAGSTTPLIQDVGVFSDYHATGDWLFCAEVILTYPPYYPTGIPSEYFQLQLISDDGTTILGATAIRQWGDRPASIYLSSSANITNLSNYYLKVVNISSDNITESQSEQLTAGDWKGSDLVNLDDWCRGVAVHMQGYDGTTSSDPYVKTVTDVGIIITDTAGGYFTTGIPAIDRVRPRLFSSSKYGVTVPTLSSTISYNSGTTIDDELGTTITTDAETVGNVFGLTATQTLQFGILGILVIFVVSAMSQGGGSSIIGVLCLSIPIMASAMYFHITTIQIITVIAIVFAFIFVWKFVLSRL